MSDPSARSSLKVWHIDAAGLLIVVGLFLGLYVLRVEPLLAQHEQALAEANQLSQQQAKSREIEQALVTLQQSLVSLEEALADQHRQLQTPGDLNTRLARLTELANAHSVQIDSLESATGGPLDRLGAMTIRMSGQCDYRSFTELLAALRKSMPDVGVLAMQLSGADVVPGSKAHFVSELRWQTTLPTAATSN